MEDSSSPNGTPVPWLNSANDRLKAGWNRRVRWSTAAAVVIHAGLFLGWPDQFREAPESDPESEPLQLEWITIAEDDPSLRAQSPQGLPVIEANDSLRVEDDRPGLPEGEGEVVASLEELFENRLLSNSAPRPTLAEPELREEAVRTSNGNEEGEGADFDADAATSELPEWLGASPMELDRLNAVRPELAVVAPSAWVLIRNPREVEEFIRRTYRQGELDRNANGSVSVALWIDGRGRVEWAEISESSGSPDMDEVALALFSEVAVFRPARQEGSPTPRSVIFSVQFPWVQNY